MDAASALHGIPVNSVWMSRLSGRRIRVDHVWMNQVQVHNRATGRISRIRVDRFLREFKRVEQ